MGKEGFTLEPVDIANDIAAALRNQQAEWSLSVYNDSYMRPDGQMVMWIHDPVDRAVVTFVGTRDQANAIARAAKEILDG